MARKPALTDEQWLELVKFYHKDPSHNYAKCAVQFGISQSTVAHWFQKHAEIPRREPLGNRGRSVTREESPSPPGGSPSRVIVPLK